MTAQKPVQWPFVVMMIIYGLILAGSSIILMFGLAFGSEAYRSNGIPLAELAIIIAPFAIAITLLISTIILWNRDKYKATYILFGLSSSIIFILLLSVTGLFS